MFFCVFLKKLYYSCFTGSRASCLVGASSLWRRWWTSAARRNTSSCSTTPRPPCSSSSFSSSSHQNSPFGHLRHGKILDRQSMTLKLFFMYSKQSRRALLDWPYVQKRFPWGVAILFGGGFALAGRLIILLVEIKTQCQIVCTMRFQRVSKILTPRRMLQKTRLIA